MDLRAVLWHLDWLRAGRPRGWSSSPDRVKNFHLCIPLSLGPIQPPIEWAPGVKWPGREAYHSSPIRG
jgi:hypothetical protein